MPQTISITPANSSAAQFRAWGSTLSAAIAANGQVQTADTGQINWTTVALPASNTAAGYEIWRFADTLQATAPVYIKLEYGFTTALGCQIWMTVGSGSDGAGTITGVVSGVLTPQIAPRTTLGPGAGTPVAVPTPTYVNGAAGCLAILFCPNNNTAAWAGFLLLIERTKDGSGADTGDGLLILVCSSGTSGAAVSCFLTFLPGVRQTVSALAYITGWPVLFTSFTSIVQSMTVNGVVYPAQVFTGTGPKGGGPSQYVTALTASDIAAAQVVAVTHYGTSRNWYSGGIGSTNAGGWGAIGPSSNDMTLLKSFLFRIN